MERILCPESERRAINFPKRLEIVKKAVSGCKGDEEFLHPKKKECFVRLFFCWHMRLEQRRGERKERNELFVRDICLDR